MRLNTTRSMKLARRVKSRFGTWQAVREAARVENGVYVVPAEAPAEPVLQEKLRPAKA